VTVEKSRKNEILIIYGSILLAEVIKNGQKEAEIFQSRLFCE